MINIDKMRKNLKHCGETVPYYRNLFVKYNVDVDSDDILGELRKLPVLRKQDVLMNKTDMVSDIYDLSKLVVEYTSGSTGEPLVLYKTASDRINIGKEIWKLRKERFGITPKDVSCRFHILLQNDDGEFYATPIKIYQNSISLSLFHLYDEKISEYYKVLDESNVSWIFGMPSALFQIARYIKKNNLPKIQSLKCIELSGEYRTESTKKEIADAFQCPVLDFYGTREVYGIGVSCLEGKMHTLDENVYVEVLDSEGNMVEDGQKGNVYVTTINSRAMPLLRYETGDIATIHYNVKCQCGKVGDIIELDSARVVDYIEFEDGTKMNSAVLYCAIVEVGKEFGDDLITQFQMKQVDYNNFKVKLVLSNDEVQLDKLKKSFEENVYRFGMRKANWKFEIVDSIPVSRKTGKLKYFLKIGAEE